MASLKPRHMDINVTTGEVTYTDLTPEEIAENAKISAAWEKELKTANEKAATRIKIINDKAKEDPAYKALAEILGII